MCNSEKKIAVLVICLLVLSDCLLLSNMQKRGRQFDELNTKYENKVVELEEYIKISDKQLLETTKVLQLLELELDSANKKIDELKDAEKKRLEELEKQKQQEEVKKQETKKQETKVKPVSSGNTMTFEATAYAGDPITATGTVPKVGRTIAVDPKVIPYGTKVRIEGMGTYIAEDCGGAIKGNMIDIFMGSEAECRNWGRRNVQIEILK